MSTENSRHAPSANYGLPPRPPSSSTPLWEHLMKTKGSTAPSLRNMPLIAPPSGPLDKNATSMKVLLHDTQANFEKFGKYSIELLEEAKSTRHEIKTVHTLFQRDRESLMGDIVDLVNRSQKEIQKTVGKPAQSDSMHGFLKDISHRISELDQRLDAIQAFNQSHTQNLQTQIQAVQILLDKQGSIMTSVLPLLPLLQAVPLHIEALKSSLQESFMKCMSWRNVSGLTSDSSSTVSDAIVEKKSEPVMENSLGKRKRTDKAGTTALSTSSTASPSGSTSTETSSNKRSRVQHTPRDLAALSTARQPSAPFIERLVSFSPSHLQKANSSSRTKNPTTPLLSDSSPAIAKENVQSTPSTHRGTFLVPQMTTSNTNMSTTTPRKPLTDLLSHLSSDQLSVRNVSERLRQQRSASREVSVERSLILAGGQTPTAAAASSPSLHNVHLIHGMTPTAARPPRILRVQSSFTRRRLSTTTTATHTSGTANDDNDSLPTGLPAASASASLPHTACTDVVQPSPRQTFSPVLARAGTPVCADTITTSTPSSAQAESSNHAPPLSVGQRNYHHPNGRKQFEHVVLQLQPTGPRPQRVNGGSGSVMFQSRFGPTMSFTKPKDRRSPSREGRRFIPLVDSEDEQEDEG